MTTLVDLSAQDGAFLQATRGRMAETGATTYLIGSQSGTLTLDIVSKRFGRSPEHSMSQALRDILLQEGVIDMQASAHQTHSFLKGASDFPLRSDVLKNADENGEDLENSEGPSVA